MNVPFLDLGRSHRLIQSDLDTAWRDTLADGAFILGPRTAAFERGFAAYCGVSHALGVANGLDAIVMVLRALGIGPGDEVVVPANTFIATWLAVDQVGARVVPADCDARSGNLSPAALAAAITPATKAVIVVHLYGYPADLDGLLAVTRAQGIHLIEDAAQAHGATYHGARIGSFGTAATFSFYPTKNLGALGDGGAVVTNDAALAEKISLLRNYGSQKKYYHEIIGQNSRLDELQSAFLTVKLAHLDAWNTERRKVADSYQAAFRGLDNLILPPRDQHIEPVWHLYTVRSPFRDRLAVTLGERGVATMVHYPVPPHLQPAYQHLGYKRGRFPVAEQIAAETLSLPLWPGMTDVEVAWVIDSVRHVVR